MHLPPIERLEPRQMLSAYWSDTGWAERLNSDKRGGYGSVPLGVRTDGSLIVYDQRRLNGGVRRYLPDGTPDLRFGDGKIDDVWITDAALDVADRVVVAHGLGSPSSPKPGHQVRRFTPAGKYDLRFAGDGVLDIDAPAPGARLQQITTDRLGHILVVMSTDQGPMLGRIHSHGRLDITFGNRGWVRVPADDGYGAAPMDAPVLEPQLLTLDVRILPDNRILVVAKGGGGFQVLAFDDRGGLDTTWGRNGRFTLPRLFSSYFDRAPDVTIDDAGRMLVSVPARSVGYTIVPPPDGLVVESVARLLPNGRLDLHFGDRGFAALRTREAAWPYRISAPVIDAKGRIYVADGKDVIARLLPDGTPDRSFDFDGQFSNYAYDSSLFAHGDDLVLTSGNGWHKRITPAPGETFLAGRTLRVIAGEPGGTVSVLEQGRQIVIRVRGVTTSYERKQIDDVVVRLSEGDDRFVYDSSASLRLDAGAGDDALDLQRGKHEVHAGAGDDTVTCGDNEDTVYADTGHDLIDLGGGRGKVFAYGRGYDDLDSIDVRAAPDDRFFTSVDAQRLHSAIVRVSGGNAYISADALHARIATSGEPAQVILKGPANSTARVDTGNQADYVHAGAGRATIRTFGGNDSIYKLSGVAYIDAGDGDDSVRGGAGAETILGGSGSDTLRGNGGDDSLDAGTGNDRLFGNDGADTLIGGAGYDRAAKDVLDTVSLIELLA